MSNIPIPDATTATTHAVMLPLDGPGPPAASRTFLTWQRGLEMFKNGTYFGVTRDRKITTGDALGDLLEKYADDDAYIAKLSKMASWKKGAHNSFGVLLPKDCRYVTNQTNCPESDVGLRIQTEFPSNDVSDEELYRLQWDEVWLTLYAAVKDVGPLVYAIGSYGIGERLGMLVQKGTHSLIGELEALKRTGLDTDLLPEATKTRAKAVSRSLAELVKKTGEIGLLLADIKAGNMIVLDGADGPSVKMIDFDPRYTRLVPRPTPGAVGTVANSECVEFVNGLWLLSFLACWHRAAAHLLVEDLIVRLRDIGHLKFSGDERGLCNVLRTLNAKGNQLGYPQLEASDESLVLPELLIYTMAHYMGWEEGEDEACDAFSHAKSGTTTVLDNLWEIAVRIATVTGRGRKRPSPG